MKSVHIGVISFNVTSVVGDDGLDTTSDAGAALLDILLGQVVPGLDNGLL
ncbi:Uncharacterized protein FKW44_020912 [Caligus rogercresseyi]|uniref:Uncharacterized protein n=1 Tax=Caligus rogercresseyi TaxID=217165 RepID=A0A7T8GR13_CALRO|nr:Uncharacterized protein FKW44_020912 [Caligus rogercresseyi]